MDYRETDLLAECRRIIAQHSQFAECPEIRGANLPIGDILITSSDYELESASNSVKVGKEYLIIERKTIADLLASIKDGRYEEQSYRLRGCGHPWHNIVYLIEGMSGNGAGGGTGTGCKLLFKRGGANSTTGDSQFTFFSALFSLNYQKGFSVMRSVNLAETAFIILNYWYKFTTNVVRKKIIGGGAYDIPAPITTSTSAEPIEKSECKSEVESKSENESDTNVQEDLQQQQQQPQCPAYSSLVKKQKKENITAQNIQEIMLCQIPGISSAVAASILAHGPYKGIPELSAAIRADPNCLNDARMLSGGKKIGKNVIAKLVEYLG